MATVKVRATCIAGAEKLEQICPYPMLIQSVLTHTPHMNCANIGVTVISQTDKVIDLSKLSVSDRAESLKEYAVCRHPINQQLSRLVQQQQKKSEEQTRKLLLQLSRKHPQRFCSHYVTEEL